MIFLRRSLFFLLLGLVPAVFAAAAKKQHAKMEEEPSYKGAIVLDATSGKVLFEDNADVVSPPASMTKLMTFAVLYDQIARGDVALTTPVRITNEDYKMGGTQVFLDPRETFPVEELVYAMMIQSANDAAHALARAAAGSVGAFVELMNEKAAALGMKNTKFRTPHGLPPSNRKIADGDLTSPRDFAVLSRHLVLNTDVLKYTAIRNRAFGTGVRAQPMAMTNHNNLVGKVAGVDGLKTGFTNGAGFCLAATAQRNGRRVIVVTMGSPQARARDLNVTELIDRGFTALPRGPASSAAREPLLTPAPAPAPVIKPAATEPEPPIKFSVPKR